MIKNRVYKLKKSVEIAKDMPLQAGQEIEIVMDVVYINGHMVPPSLQAIFYDWVVNNQNVLTDVTKNW